MKSINSNRALVALALLSLVACGGAQTGSGDGEGGSTDGTTGASVEAAGPTDGGEGEGAPASPPCAAFDSDEQDPLLRWVDAFPVERGGAVIAFTGTTAEQMEVEMVLEMRGVAGYEAVTCGTAVVLWVLGLECEGDEEAIANAVTEETPMNHYSTACFRLDEVRPRMVEECERGTISAARCGG